MIFGHLKAADFTNLIEGETIAPRRQKHLDGCARCQNQFKGVEGMFRSVSEIEDEPLEPDWSEFRDSVRERMLARSAVRSAEVKRWAPWKLVPAGAALGAAIGIGLLLHSYMDSKQAQPVDPAVAVESLADAQDVWVRASAFEDIMTLGPEESERFRELLEQEVAGTRETRGTRETIVEQ
ncbi:MAG TPA: hypothetical protein VFY29_03845 [Terriglobia bacterium]|nr:hypothetical protein [Terriglobia bacterium]